MIVFTVRELSTKYFLFTTTKREREREKTNSVSKKITGENREKERK
jgi:hypothetical protein